MTKWQAAKRSGLYGTLSGVVALLASESGTAQSSSSDLALETITVTAQRKAEDIQSVPIAVQALTGEQVRDLGVRSSADIGKFAANVSVTQPAGDGTITIVTIRGIGLNDYNTNNSGPNGVYIDEVYLSAPVAQTFRPFDLERIEVLKGPQGTLYGRNTSGGAINYITNKPTDRFAMNLNTSYGSFDTTQVEGAIGGPLASGLNARVAVSLDHSRGYFKNTANGRHENGSNTAAGRGMLSWTPDDALSMLLSMNYGVIDVRGAKYRHVGTLDPATGAQCSTEQTLSGQCVDLFGFGTPEDFYRGEYNREDHLKTHVYGGSLRADYQPSEVTMTSLTSFIHTDRFFPEDSDANPLRLLEVDYGTGSSTITQELRASMSTSRYNWVVGAYYLGERLTQDQPVRVFQDIDLVYGPGAGDGLAQIINDNSKQITDAYAAFGQGDYNITPQLAITLGARYSYETRDFQYDQNFRVQSGGIDSYGPTISLPHFSNKLSNSGFNYRAALKYQFTDDVMVYASNATGFKSGGFNGGFLSQDPAEVAAQLRPVRSEHVTAYELGMKAELFEHRVVLNIAAFYNDYEDMQLFTPIDSPIPSNAPLNVLDNAPRAHTEGLELQILAMPIRGLVIDQNLGLLTAKLDKYAATLAPGVPDYSGNRLSVSPKLSSSTTVEYTVPIGTGQAEFLLNANYKTKQFFDTTNNPLLTQAAYWLVNARAAYTFGLGDGELQVAAFGRNLLDEEYLVGASDLSQPFGLLEDIPGRDREFGVEVNFRL